MTALRLWIFLFLLQFPMIVHLLAQNVYSAAIAVTASPSWRDREPSLSMLRKLVFINFLHQGEISADESDPDNYQLVNSEYLIKPLNV